MIWLLDISVQSCFIGKFAKDGCYTHVFLCPDSFGVEHCLAPGKETFERAQPFLFVSWRCYVGVLGIVLGIGWLQPDSTIRVFAKAMLVNIYI